MVNIAIVDDNKVFLQEMKQNIEACKEFTADMVCDTYCSGADFQQADRGAYQLVVLDMQMAEISGYETAQKLRERDGLAVIAFVSGVILPEPEHFRVQPYRYLLKNSDADERMRDMEELLRETKRRSRGEMAEVVSDGEAQRVPVRSILYIEKTKRGSCLTVEAGAAGGKKTLQSNERLEEW